MENESEQELKKLKIKKNIILILIIIQIIVIFFFTTLLLEGLVFGNHSNSGWTMENYDPKVNLKMNLNSYVYELEGTQVTGSKVRSYLYKIKSNDLINKNIEISVIFLPIDRDLFNVKINDYENLDIRLNRTYHVIGVPNNEGYIDRIIIIENGKGK